MDRRSEMLYSLQALKQFGVETVVVAGRSLGLHGTGYSAPFEDYDSLKVYRLYRDLTEMFVTPRIHYGNVLALARQFSPDVILASQEMTTRLAAKLARALGIPLVLWVETPVSDLARGRIRVEQRIPFSLYLTVAGMPPTILGWWNWIVRHCDAIVTCNPSDRPYLDSLRASGKVIEYLPWPIGLDLDNVGQLRALPKERYGIYAGSLLQAKNIREFGETVPKILGSTSTEKFMFVGHGEEEHVILQLRQRFGNRVFYARDLPKEKVVELIARAWFAYTPVRRYGSWQFIGDCWGLGTPLIATFDSGYVEPGHDCVVVAPEKVPEAVDQLFHDPGLRQRIVQGGFATANERSPKRIASKLLSILEKCVDTHAN
jgi:glycosyltransferase involved in cell wall biosynthesis